MSRRQDWVWSEHQLAKLQKTQAIIAELDEYKPLTVRAVYYQFVAKGLIENTHSQFTMISSLLKWARIDGFIPWADIEDRHRIFHDFSGWGDVDGFVDAHINNFLSRYRRNLQRGQERYLEIWVEKDALSPIFEKVAEPFRIPLVIDRGSLSVSFLNNYRRRVNAVGADSPVILYFGDFDPSGVAIPRDMAVTLVDELNVERLEIDRVALNQEDIAKYRLPHDEKAVKAKDCRSSAFLEEYGAVAVELDALPPAILKAKVQAAIGKYLDVATFEAERKIEAVELAKANRMRKAAVTAFKKIRTVEEKGTN